MTDYIDPYPNLSKFIDVGGDRYFLGTDKEVELGYKSRIQYIQTFGGDKRTEYLLRKYLFLGPQTNIQFTDKNEKNELILILKNRLKHLKSSSEISSSLLKNTRIQRIYINIQKLIQDLEDTGLQKKLPSKCTPPEKTLTENQLFQIIIEIAWYLLHPNDVPQDIQCEWNKIISKLDTLRIGDIISEIKSEQKDNNYKPLNYFKRINLDTVVKKPTIQNALDIAKKMASHIESDEYNKLIKERLKSLLHLLEMKKYLDKSLSKNKNGMTVVTKNGIEKIDRELISNPMSGGSLSLQQAMYPLFDYFKVMFNPVYDFLESTILQTDINTIKIPNLLTILHICNNLIPTDTNYSGNHTYGVYRIDNVPDDILLYFKTQLQHTESFIQEFKEENQFIFKKQLFKLPKVRLSSLISKNGGLATYSQQDSLPYIQFFILNENMTIPDSDTFFKRHKNITDKTYEAINEFFISNSLYIVCTDSDHIYEDIPLNVHTIDYNLIDITKTLLQINNIPNNYFNDYKKKEIKPELFLDKVIDLKENTVFNDAELALSIFILLKQLMP